MAVQEAPLPAGWVERQNWLSGRTYYYNEEDRTTAFTRPTVEGGSAQQVGSKQSALVAPEGAPAGAVHLDDTAGTEDGVAASAQAVPAAPTASVHPSAGMAVQEAPLPAGWVELWTLGGRAYYYNEEKKTTAMKRPTA